MDRVGFTFPVLSSNRELWHKKGDAPEWLNSLSAVVCGQWDDPACPAAARTVRPNLASDQYGRLTSCWKQSEADELFNTISSMTPPELHEFVAQKSTQQTGVIVPMGRLRSTPRTASRSWRPRSRPTRTGMLPPMATRTYWRPDCPNWGSTVLSTQLADSRFGFRLADAMISQLHGP